MPLHPTWDDIALRLLLTVVAGAAIGLDRGSKGHAAGFRTTILVGLAAAVAMIQANVLLSVGGKAADSFGVMDLMRLPLGILTGVGFIGGGAILKRGDLVLGVTTAATLWVMTVIGLCLGGGQIGLGVAATVLAVLTLTLLKWLDSRIPREHHAVLVVRAASCRSVAADLATALAPLGYRARFQCQSVSEDASSSRIQFEISWRRPDSAGPPLDLVALLDARFAVVSFDLPTESHH